MKGIFLLLIFALSVSCSKKLDKKMIESAPLKDYSKQESWFKGSFEQAVLESKRTGKHIFLYWGAVWCPPCNRLKSTVFKSKKFSEMMKQVIPVYLDGDNTAAQKLGSALKVTSYPTLILINKEKQELMRFAGSLDAAKMQSALKAAISFSAPIQNALKKALSGNADKDTWQLIASYSWGQAPYDLFDKKKELEIRFQLLEKLPKDLNRFRPFFLASFLRSAKLNENHEISKNFRTELPTALGEILASESSHDDLKGFLSFEALGIIEWGLYPDQLAKEKLISDLEASLRKLFKEKKSELYQNVWLYYSLAQIEKMRNKGELSQNTINLFSKSLLDLLSETDDVFKRKAAVSGVAYVLDFLGKAELGRNILTEEIKSSDAPWYFASALASLEKRNGNVAQSLNWSNRSYELAKGDATRLQWGVSNIINHISLAPKKAEKIFSLTDDLFEHVFSLEDSFSGRNMKYLKTLRNKVSENDSMIKFKEYLKIKVKKCEEYSQKSFCLSYFKEL